MLAIFDLDGFKAYNDTYGARPVGGWRAWRSCRCRDAGQWTPLRRVLRPGAGRLPATARSPPPSPRLSRTRLHGRAATGVAGSRLTRRTTPPRRCVADQRLYTAKDSRPTAPVRQAREALRQILIESEPELDNHHDYVGDRHAVAVALGIEGASCEPSRGRTHVIEDRHPRRDPAQGRAADRRGVAIHAPPHDDRRALAASPRLKTVALSCAPATSASTGSASASPQRRSLLGARIIFACDAYHAMTADRPYRAGMSHDEALAELARYRGPSSLAGRLIGPPRNAARDLPPRFSRAPRLATSPDKWAGMNGRASGEGARPFWGLGGARAGGPGPGGWFGWRGCRGCRSGPGRSSATPSGSPPSSASSRGVRLETFELGCGRRERVGLVRGPDRAGGGTTRPRAPRPVFSQTSAS